MAAPETAGADALEARLDRLEAKLDALLARGDAGRDLVDEAGPIIQSMGRAAVSRFAELEEKGYFTFGKHALRALDRVVASYGEAEMAAFADAAVHITDTLRDLTQPEVLATIDAAGRAAVEGGEPLSAWGAMRATRDPEVQRGLAIVFAVLRGLGRRRSDGQAPSPPRLPIPRATAGVGAGDQPPAALEPAPAAKVPARALAADDSREAAVEGGRFDHDGFLLDPDIWTTDLGGEIAAHLGVEMTEDHWRAVNWARNDWRSTGASPNVRRVATGSGLGTRALYALFPRQPGKTIARVAGIPKPVGCL